MAASRRTKRRAAASADSEQPRRGRTSGAPVKKGAKKGAKKRATKRNAAPRRGTKKSAKSSAKRQAGRRAPVKKGAKKSAKRTAQRPRASSQPVKKTAKRSARAERASAAKRPAKKGAKKGAKKAAAVPTKKSAKRPAKKGASKRPARALRAPVAPPTPPPAPPAAERVIRRRKPRTVQPPPSRPRNAPPIIRTSMPRGIRPAPEYIRPPAIAPNQRRRFAPIESSPERLPKGVRDTTPAVQHSNATGDAVDKFRKILRWEALHLKHERGMLDCDISTDVVPYANNTIDAQITVYLPPNMTMEQLEEQIVYVMLEVHGQVANLFPQPSFVSTGWILPPLTETNRIDILRNYKKFRGKLRVGVNYRRTADAMIHGKRVSGAATEAFLHSLEIMKNYEARHGRLPDAFYVRFGWSQDGRLYRRR